MVKAPASTTVNNQEYVPEKGGIGFAPELLKIILSGHKSSTYRFGRKYDYLKIGDTVRIENSDTGEIACIAKVTNKSQTTFANLPIKGDVHETFRDKDHQRQVLNGYYAFLGRPINNDDEFLRFEFELVTKTPD